MGVFESLVETVAGKLPYINQCDRFRRQPGGEQKWQLMMQNAKKVSRAEFLRKCDLSPILDDGETGQSLTRYWEQGDSTTGYYKSTWGAGEVYFAGTGGFEFIFGK